MMDKSRNIRIVKNDEARIARRIVADIFGSEFFSQEKVLVHELGDEYRIMFSLNYFYCERYIIKNGIPVSCEDCFINFNGNGLKEISKKASLKNSIIHNSIIYDYLVKYKNKRNDFLNGSRIEDIRNEYEEDPENAKDLYEYDTFQQYMDNEWSDVKYHAWSQKARKQMFIAIWKMMDNGGDISSTYDVQCGAINYSMIPQSENDIPKIKDKLLKAKGHYDNSMMTDEEINRIFASKGNVSEMIHGFDVGYLKNSTEPDWYQNILLPALSIVEKKMSSKGYSFLLGIRIREGNNAERVGMQYIKPRDEITMVNAIGSSDVNWVAYGLIHELGHRLHYKFATKDQKDEMKRAFDSKRTHFSSLKKGDSLVMEDGEQLVVDVVDRHKIRLVSRNNTVEIEDIALLLKKIASINGKPFLYEANGIPSNYSLFNEEEFFAECFTSWISDKFSGNTKKFFDDVFKK